MTWYAPMPLIAILRGITPDDVASHVSTLIEVGIRLIEIPTNSPDWSRSVAIAARVAGSDALVGAGTVLTVADADALIAAGGRLMVTPHIDPKLIRYAAERGLICAAGFATPSEAFAAIGAGAQALKLFPAAHFGPGYVRALKAVLPAATPVFAVGGVTPDDLGDFLRAGCVGAGLGGDLYAPGQSTTITRTRAERFVAAYREGRR
jgi:2-dehydro-3-deoxyphosphogalactonate aldolase